MANKSDVELVVSAVDEASAVFKNVGKSFSSMTSRFKTETKILTTATKAIATGIAVTATALTGAFVAFSVSSVKAFAESEKKMASFDAQIKALGKSGEKAREGLLKASSAVVKLGFDDEQASLGLVRFYQRTKDVEQATKLNTLAMDLARAKNIDYETATQMVTLALSGNARALKEYGIEIKEGQNPLKVMADLQRIVGGQAEAYTKTLSGQMDVIGMTFENLEETFGGAMAKVLKPFTDWLLEIASSDEAQKTIQALSDYVATTFQPVVVNIIAKIKEWWKEIGGAEGLKQKITEAIGKIKEWWSETEVMRQKIAETTRFIIEHKDQILVAIITWEALKVTLSIVDLVKNLAGAFLALSGAVASVPIITVLVTAGAIASIVMALKYAYDLKEAMEELEDATNDAYKGLGKLQERAKNLPKGSKERADAMEDQKRYADSMLRENSKSSIWSSLPSWITGRASGGSVASGRPYIVGEHRPEMFVPHQSGNIKQMSDGSGSLTINFGDVHVTETNDIDRIVSKIKEVLRHENRLAKNGVTI